MIMKRLPGKGSVSIVGREDFLNLHWGSCMAVHFADFGWTFRRKAGISTCEKFQDNVDLTI